MNELEFWFGTLSLTVSFLLCFLAAFFLTPPRQWKNKFSWLVKPWLWCVLLCCVVITACGTAGGLFTPQTVIHTVLETNSTILTNIVVQTNTVTVTNSIGVTQLIPTYTTNVTTTIEHAVVTNIVNITNGYTVSAGASNALATIGAVNTATAPLDPYTGLVGSILALAAGGLGWIAKIKTAQAQSSGSVAQTLITAIEGLPPTVAPLVKTAVQTQSLRMGTQPAVTAAVSGATESIASKNLSL
jgi:hypothetical protein